MSSTSGIPIYPMNTFNWNTGIATINIFNGSDKIYYLDLRTTENCGIHSYINTFNNITTYNIAYGNTTECGCILGRITGSILYSYYLEGTDA